MNKVKTTILSLTLCLGIFNSSAELSLESRKKDFEYNKSIKTKSIWAGSILLGCSVGYATFKYLSSKNKNYPDWLFGSLAGLSATIFSEKFLKKFFKDDCITRARRAFVLSGYQDFANLNSDEILAKVNEIYQDKKFYLIYACNHLTKTKNLLLRSNHLYQLILQDSKDNLDEANLKIKEVDAFLIIINEVITKLESNKDFYDQLKNYKKKIARDRLLNHMIRHNASYVPRNLMFMNRPRF